MSKTIKIPGRIESVATGKVVTGANFILDDTKGKKQNVINEETDAELLRLDQEKQGNLTFDQTPTEDSTNPVTSGGVYAADQILSQAIEAILLLIPSAASELNKLVDLATMNSSISTATASFKGTYNLVSDLHLTVSATHAQIAAALDVLSLGADNNDYAFVQVPNTDTAPTDIAKTERYKFNGDNWAYEYDLNNSGFTTAQWNAINSGITTLLVAKLSALPTNEALTLALEGKQDNLTFDNAPTAGSNNPVKSGGIYTRNNEIVALINALDAAKQDVLVFDTTPTNGSTNPVTSNGVYLAIQLVQTAVVALDGRMGTAETKISTAEGNIVNLQAAYAALTQSDIVVVEGALPSSGQQQNIIYRQPDQDHTPPQFYSDYMWNGTAWVLMATYNNAIDDKPTAGSDNLVKSSGVFNDIEDINNSLFDSENEVIITTGVDNSYIKYEDGTTTSSSNFKISSPIQLNKGKQISAVVAGYNSMATIALTDANASFYKPVVAGIFTDSVIGVESHAVYLAVEDCHVVVCSYKGKFPSSVKIKDSVYADYTNKQIEGRYLDLYHPTYQVNGGYYRINGEFHSHNDFVYTTPILFKKGDIVVIEGTDTNISAETVMLAQCNQNGDFVKCVLYGDATKSTYQYTIAEDGYYFAGWRSSRLENFTILRFASEVNDTDSINNLNSYINREVEEIQFVNGGWYKNYVSEILGQTTLEYNEDNLWASLIIQVQKGDIFIITGKAGNSGRLWSFAKGNTTQIVDIAPNGADVSNLVIVAPEDGRLIANTQNGVHHRLLKVRKSANLTDVDLKISMPATPLVAIQDVSLASIIHDWGFIGDSLMSGYLENYSTPHSVYEYSWGQRMCRMLGTNGYNFSFGGQTTKGWKNSTGGQGETLTEEEKQRTWYGAKTHKKQGYIIGLGVNDRNNGMTVGSVTTDIGVYDSQTDTDTNADTYAGNYAGIIQRIKSIQPNAKIFVVTNPDNAAGVAAYNNVVRDIAEHFDLFIIDLAKYGSFMSTPDFIQKLYGVSHLNVIGYQYFASVFFSYIEWIIQNNMSEFLDINTLEVD